MKNERNEMKEWNEKKEMKGMKWKKNEIPLKYLSFSKHNPKKLCEIN